VADAPKVTSPLSFYDRLLVNSIVSLTMNRFRIKSIPSKSSLVKYYRNQGDRLLASVIESTPDVDWNRIVSVLKSE